jgi:hypothetical protein
MRFAAATANIPKYSVKPPASSFHPMLLSALIETSAAQIILQVILYYRGDIDVKQYRS